MNELSLPSADLSDVVDQLFASQSHICQRILAQIRYDIEGRQHLHNQILETIDNQISRQRTRLRELESRFQTDSGLWLHPRRTQLEQQLSEWHKQRLDHLTLAWEHIDKLRREYRDASKAFQESQKTQFLLQNITGNRYPNW